MKNILGRRLNYWAVMGTVTLAAAVYAAGAFRDWWPASPFAGFLMIAMALGAGWLFGKPQRKPFA